MHESMIPQELPTFIFDDDGDFISCAGTTLENLTPSAAKAKRIRVGTQTGRITTAMRDLTKSLQALRQCSGDDDFSHLSCTASEAYGEVRRNSRMRVLTGLSPDESTLILIFARRGSASALFKRGLRRSSGLGDLRLV
jgi:hypothetical protein